MSVISKGSAARSGTSVVQGCVDARVAVQKWFTDDGIRLTERTRDDALRLRRELLDKLAVTQKKQADAKAKRDAKPGDSSAQSEYDRATEDMRNAEKALPARVKKSIEDRRSLLR